MKHKIAVIAGDGIGKEVMPEGLRVLDAAMRKFGLDLEFITFDWAHCDYYAAHGKMMPDDWFEQLRGFDASPTRSAHFLADPRLAAAVILLLVVLAAGPLHGYRLVERISDLALSGGQVPDASGVYRYLKTMETKGLVASTWILSEAGPAKRSYQLTADGERCLRKWISTLETYRDGITALLKAARKAAALQDSAQA